MPSTLLGKEIPLNTRLCSLICSPCQSMAWTKNLICPRRIITHDNLFVDFHGDLSYLRDSVLNKEKRDRKVSDHFANVL